jgi:RNA polymerase sigma-70 factor (ECF subfamily)
LLRCTVAEEPVTKPMAEVAGGEDHDREWEHDLVARIQNGDREAFAGLVRQFQKRIFTLAYGFFHDRDDALEIVQETFMRVYEKIGSYRPEHSLQSWIYRLGYNLCVDNYRKHAQKRKLEGGFDNVPDRQLATADDPQAAWESRQNREAIARAVESLSRKQKEVFSLKYSQGLKLRQVAEVMAISLGTVKALHHRALKQIRRQVAPAGAGGKYESMS